MSLLEDYKELSEMYDKDLASWKKFIDKWGDPSDHYCDLEGRGPTQKELDLIKRGHSYFCPTCLEMHASREPAAGAAGGYNSATSSDSDSDDDDKTVPMSAGNTPVRSSDSVKSMDF